MDAAGAPAEGGRKAGKSLFCRLGVHRWEDKVNDDGERYVECRRCGQDDTKISLKDYGDTGGGSMG